MTQPVRIQLKRTKGFRLQAVSLALNGLPAVKVDRTTIYGNPCVCSRPYGCPHSKDFEREEDGSVDPLRCCVDVYRHYVETGLKGEPTTTGRLWFACEGALGYPHRKRLIAALPDLRGCNLACWCELPKDGEPDICHAAVLLELSNSSQAGTTP